MTKYMKSLKIGNPLEEATSLPPLARLDLVEEVHSQVGKTISEGARLMC